MYNVTLQAKGFEIVPLTFLLPSSIPSCFCFFSPSSPVLFILLLGGEESQGAAHQSMSQPEAAAAAVAVSGSKVKEHL